MRIKQSKTTKFKVLNTYFLMLNLTISNNFQQAAQALNYRLKHTFN